MRVESLVQLSGRYGRRGGWRARLCALFVLLSAAFLPAQTVIPRPHTPPRVAQEQRFLSQRGIQAGRIMQRPQAPSAQTAWPAGTAAWQPLGPSSVTSISYGAISGRVTSIAFDPADTTGGSVYIGTTGGGVWRAQSADSSDTSSILFTPLTDSVNALSSAVNASISIGALTVQPGGMGVLLAGTGDPNDALDSYYGAGILRSTDNGTTWSLIQQSSDLQTNAGLYNYGFFGMGFAGFAWSTSNPQTVVAAVSSAYEGTLVDAQWPGTSMAGLYYSNDSGATWHLSSITDLNGKEVQGPDQAANAGGNPATSVVWNPWRNLFLAAVQYHGYYTSPDGVKWTQLAAQPGANLTVQLAKLCPTNISEPGSPACPVFRGTLAVNPQTGDTFAWSVDLNNQDQGIWQDVCGLQNGTCANSNIAFSKQWSTTALETNTTQGAYTIANGDYDLALTAIPSGQDTLLLAGANDLWRCSLAENCAWRNTSNAFTCMSAQVGPYQHAITWSGSTLHPLEMLIGNDSGLWRSMDAAAETGSVCNTSSTSGDATHFQNLNGGLGSLTEVESMSQVGASPYTMLMGLGVNGTAGVKSTTGPTAQWPEILSGAGGPVAIDPSNPENWYVNNGAGVSIHLCSQSSPCTQADFGVSAIVTNEDTGNDGLVMTQPAPFLVDPVDPSQLLIGTCRVWRGPASGPGSGWSAANAVSPLFGNGSGTSSCSSNAMIRTMAASRLANGGEVVYLGMYGSLNGGANLAGHVLTATMDASGAWSSWTDLSTSLHPVLNDLQPMNAYGLDISSVYVDPHDTSGQTVYVTVEGMPSEVASISTIYRSVDGGAHWSVVMSNLPFAPANSVTVDPMDANTVYVATDIGVYATQAIASCAAAGSVCWQPLGAGLPMSPVVTLSATPTGGSPATLVAGTYGRGLWQIPLLTAGQLTTTASLTPASLTFGNQSVNSASSPLTLTVTNTGGIGLSLTTVTLTGGDYTETDDCAQQEIAAGSSCTIQVFFAPTATGARTGKITVAGNLTGSSLVATLTGTGTPEGQFLLSPSVIPFSKQEVGVQPTQSQWQQITVQNLSTTVDVPITSLTVSAPFLLVPSENSCTGTLKADHSCSFYVAFAPTSAVQSNGTVTLVDGQGTQTAQLIGTGTSLPTDTLSPASLIFPDTIDGLSSSPQKITLSNSGGNPLTSINVAVSAQFQQSNHCTTQLAGGSSCYINVAFAPTAVGQVTGTLTITDILSQTPHTIALSGTGLAPPILTPSSKSLSFGTQQVGQSSATQVLTITNTGGAAMANVSIQLAGNSAGSFLLSGNTCGASLAAKATCTVNVAFKPAAAGGAAASLIVSSSTLNVAAATVALSGSGQGVGLSVNPTQLSFAAQALDQPSAAQSVTVTNIGSATATGVALAVSGPFSLSGNTCGASLAAGAICTTGVVFTPVSNGQLSGQLTVSSAGAPQATVALSGIGGLSGSVQLSPGNLSFPITGAGTTSGPLPVTVTNVSTTQTLSALSVSATSGFTLVSNTCGPSLAPGAACTVGVAFAPAAAGAKAGSLSVASSSLAAPASIPLSGTGFDFSVTFSGSSTVSVASGQTAGFSLTITPLGGVPGTFAFQCVSSLPQYAACAFNPSTESVAANTTGTETVDVTTSETVGSNSQRSSRALAAGLLLGGLLLLPLACFRRRGLLLLAGLALAVGSLTSCAGASGGGGSKPGSSSGSTQTTPAGTYTIPFTITAGGVQHSISATVVVD